MINPFNNLTGYEKQKAAMLYADLLDCYQPRVMEFLIAENPIMQERGSFFMIVDFSFVVKLNHFIEYNKYKTIHYADTRKD